MNHDIVTLDQALELQNFRRVIDGLVCALIVVVVEDPYSPYQVEHVDHPPVVRKDINVALGPTLCELIGGIT